MKEWLEFLKKVCLAVQDVIEKQIASLTPVVVQPAPTPIPNPVPTPTPAPVPEFKSVPFTEAEWINEFKYPADTGAFVNFQTTSVTFQPNPKESNGTVSAVDPATGQAKGTSAIMLTTKNVVAKDFVVRLTANTLAQLRINKSGQPQANAFECFWLFFNQHKAADGKLARNYLAFKPNGLEYGLSYAGVGQTFLETPTAIKFPIGVPYTLELRKQGLALELLKDGASVWKTTNPKTFNVSGPMALYSEDAKCLVSQFDVKVLA